MLCKRENSLSLSRTPSLSPTHTLSIFSLSLFSLLFSLKHLLSLSFSSFSPLRFTCTTYTLDLSLSLSLSLSLPSLFSFVESHSCFPSIAMGTDKKRQGHGLWQGRYLWKKCCAPVSDTDKALFLSFQSNSFFFLSLICSFGFDLIFACHACGWWRISLQIYCRREKK